MLKPSTKEEEYFARKEYERIKKLEEEKNRALKESEKKRLKDLHHMHCPKCGMGLVEIDFRGIKIDRCSECHGVWLDSGELEAVMQLDKPALSKIFDVFK